MKLSEIVSQNRYSVPADKSTSSFNAQIINELISSSDKVSIQVNKELLSNLVSQEKHFDEFYNPYIIKYTKK